MVDNFFSKLCHELNATHRNGQWNAKCPAHDDSSPSLWLTERDGRILVHCLAGCSQHDVITALKNRDLWPGNHSVALPSLPAGIPYFYPPASVLKKQGKNPGLDTQKAYTKHWPYRDTAGNIIGHVVRYDGHGKKDVIPFFRKWNDGNWRSGHDLKTGRALYRLDSLGPSPALETPLFIVEGEKCADALASALAGTALVVAWPGGSKSPPKVDWTPLSGFSRVILWPDFDRAGYRAMRDICQLLRGLPQPPVQISLLRVEALGIPALGPGADCADLLSAGTTLSLETLLSPNASLDAAPETYDEVYSQLSSSDGVPGEPNTAAPDAEPVDPSTLHPLTDSGNAARFADRQRHVCRYLPELGWMVFNGSVWQPDSTSRAVALARATVEFIREEGRTLKGDDRKAFFKWWHQSQNAARLKAMLEVAKSFPSMTIPYEAFDRDPLSLCCSNGVLDLRTGKLSKHSASHLITRQIPVDYDRKATCPLWLSFLHRIMDGNDALIDYLRRAIGYSLTGLCTEQVMFIMWGSGSNGKSVFLETVKHLLHSYALATPTDLLLLDARGAAAAGFNSIARLKGARFVIGSEIPQGARLNESRVKEMTGMDTLSARFLYGEFFDFVPQFKLWVRSNHRPEVAGNDTGIWRRLQCIPFVVSIPDDEKDKMLPEKLRAELPGILSWAVSGCLDWQSSGLQVPADVVAATKTYRRDMDLVGEWLDDCCVQEKDAEIAANVLYASFCSWAKSMGERVWSQRALGLNLRERGFFRVRRSSARYYQGLRLKPEVEMKTPPESQLELDKYNIF